MTNEKPERDRSGLSSFAIRHSPFLSLSLRTRILLWHGALLACVLAAFGFTAHRLHWTGELERLDAELDEPLSRLHRGMHARNRRGGPPDKGIPPPAGYEMTTENAAQFADRGWEYLVWSRSGELLAHSQRMSDTMKMPSASGVEPFVIQRRTLGSWREAWLFTPPGECFLVAVSLENDLLIARRLAWWLAALGSGVLAAGLLMDAWILRRAIRPVEDIIGAAERISRGSLSTRVESDAAESTELGRLTAVLNRTFASLENAFAQQARFSGDVAHELRTPVSVLISEAQSILERDRSVEEYREAVSTSLRSARRMSGLIESLLELARIESGAAPIRGPCDLAALCAQAAEELSAIAQSHGIALRLRLEPASCVANPAQLDQIVRNLLLNAIQHNVRGGHACLTTRTDDERAVLIVENTGPGIPASDLPHVFERFYRADASRSRISGGAGLGLAICKAIADAHQGSLTVISEANGITRFTLRLPRAEMHSPDVQTDLPARMPTA